MYNKFIRICCLMLFIATSCTAQKEQTDERYTYKEGSFDGIGKWYQGREIAHVMGYQGISWLEREEREKEENTSKLLKNMDIKSSDIIADIGAGSGYHVFKMAPLASEGLIYAVDIQEEMLAAMRKKQKNNGYRNVEFIQGTTESAKLPENSIDKVLMVDVYHEFNYPYEMLISIASALKPGGEIYLIEYRGEDNSVPIKRLHKMTEEQAIKEMKTAGFTLKENIDNLPWQHCMVFIKQ